jgi:prepilin-type N-terminal cleavage/methylation domain-containing protein
MKIIKNYWIRKAADVNNHEACEGFTFMELMMVIAIIGILAAIAIPNYIAYRRKAEIAGVASNLKNFELGFMAYAIDQGDFPDDTDIVLPDLPIMANYIDSSSWSKPTPLGGNYNWEGPDFYPYAGISITGTTASQKDLIFLDNLIDDGDLSQGNFRQTPNSRYTYILDE